MLFWLATTSCERITPAEAKVLGTWEFTGLDATVRLVFRRDHTVVSLSSQADGFKEKWAPAAWGTWRLEGNEIVTDEEVFPIGGYLPKHRQVARVPIREFGEDKLVRADGRSDFYRVHWGGEQYSQVLSLVYASVSLIVFSVSVYAIRHSAFRKKFIVLAVAAVLALVWSISTLVTELAQTGTVIISPASLRSLSLCTEVLRVACILIFIIGFVRLASSSRISAPAQNRL